MYIFWPKSLQSFIVKKCKCCLRGDEEKLGKGSVLGARQGLEDPDYDDFDHIDDDDTLESVLGKGAKDQKEDEWVKSSRRSNT